MFAGGPRPLSLSDYDIAPLQAVEKRMTSLLQAMTASINYNMPTGTHSNIYNVGVDEETMPIMCGGVHWPAATMIRVCIDEFIMCRVLSPTRIKKSEAHRVLERKLEEFLHKLKDKKFASNNAGIIRERRIIQTFQLATFANSPATMTEVKHFIGLAKMMNRVGRLVLYNIIIRIIIKVNIDFII